MSLPYEFLSETPRFVHALKFLAGELRARFDGSPRLSRLLASHQRWLLSQAAFALHVEYDPEEPVSGLTTTRLKEMILSINAASRNTVLNYLDQLQSYRFIKVAGDPARRPRRFEVTEVTVAAMTDWVLLNLKALDLIDGGTRQETFTANPALFAVMQPRIARRCLADPRWREPPPRVAIFLWTEAGGLVMDDLITRIPPDADISKSIDMGRVDAKVMAASFMMSRTHLQRLLRKAVELGCLSWVDPDRKTEMSLNPDYLAEYRRWQAVKSAIVDSVFEEACAEMRIESVPMREIAARKA